MHQSELIRFRHVISNKPNIASSRPNKHARHNKNYIINSHYITQRRIFHAHSNLNRRIKTVEICKNKCLTHHFHNLPFATDTCFKQIPRDRDLDTHPNRKVARFGTNPTVAHLLTASSMDWKGVLTSGLQTRMASCSAISISGLRTRAAWAWACAAAAACCCCWGDACCVACDGDWDGPWE